ncbi:MAG: UvrD-helicase domain-containing protein, partial [Clostridia bacterium]|nr:UvrD-helicase domain-containing protein [Clostridia bacterium]
MSESPKWTEEQREAIDAKGNIIVSAAAGSGKTAVLSERVIKLICDVEHPVSADRLLIVTFTNAAAAEMRARIEKRLDEECRSAPDNVYLLKQKHLISAAKICTIDSFCIDLVRENFELANVSPSFKIVTDAELLSIYASVFDSILARKLDENHPDFRNLLDIVDSEYGFDNLKNTVLDLFKHSKQMPFPTQFLERLRADYKLPFDQNHPWCQSILKSVEQRLVDLQNMVIRSLDRIETVENGERYNKVLQSIASAIFALLEVVKAKDWDAVRDAISLMPSFRLPGFKGCTEECYSVFKAPSDALKDEKKKLLELFELSAEEIADQISFLSGPVDQLIDFVLEFSATALNIQREENVFTFYDTEQMAFSMLCEPTDDSYRLTEAASSFFDRYDEVLVDEYQDVNNLQDMLFKILSNAEKHLFVVGDIKQSIYAFRGSNPENFLRQKD